MLPVRVSLFSFVAATLVACGQSGPADVAADRRASTDAISELPLQRGFYVLSDTACGSASSATLLLVHGGGMNGARDACHFTLIEQIGPASYRAAVGCTEFQSGAINPSTYLFEIADSTQFSYGTEDSDYRSHFRYCEQGSLPDPWRDNDISDLTAGVAGQ